MSILVPKALFVNKYLSFHFDCSGYHGVAQQLRTRRSSMLKLMRKFELFKSWLSKLDKHNYKKYICFIIDSSGKMPVKWASKIFLTKGSKIAIWYKSDQKQEPTQVLTNVCGLASTSFHAFSIKRSTFQIMLVYKPPECLANTCDNLTLATMFINQLTEAFVYSQSRELELGCIKKSLR